jgi:hypothetical protein
MSNKFEVLRLDSYEERRPHISTIRLERQWLVRVVGGVVEKRLVWGVFWRDEQVCTALNLEAGRDHLNYLRVEEVMES